MSLPAVLHEAEAIVARAGLLPEAHADVLSVLRATQSDVLSFFLALGLESKVAPATALRRAAAIYLNVAALQVADDIADGDCDYLTPPDGAGTAAQFILQNLFYAVLLDERLPHEELRSVADALVRGAGPQSIDVRRREWNIATAMAAAEGFGGAHHSAYFRIALFGSTLQDQAAGLGWALGIGVSVAGDVRSDDPRFRSLPRNEQIELLDWTVNALQPAQAIGLRSIRRAVAPIETVLVGELVRTRPSTES